MEHHGTVSNKPLPPTNASKWRSTNNTNDRSSNNNNNTNAIEKDENKNSDERDEVVEEGAEKLRTRQKCYWCIRFTGV